MTTKLSFYGHFALGLAVDDCFALIDPFFTGNPVAAKRAEDFDKVDYILVTHGHGDHVGDTVAIAKRTDAMVISNFEIVNWLAARGVPRSHAQHIGGSRQHGFGRLKLTIAHHGSSLPDGSYGGPPAGLLIRTTTAKTLYVSGDTGLFYDMKLIGDEGIDLAVLPIGDNFTMGPDDALRALELLRPKAVLPVHYGTWDLIAADAQAWAARVREKLGCAVHVLSPGESVDF